jgi:L-aminopeptidase/D-esterase-like protein
LPRHDDYRRHAAFLGGALRARRRIRRIRHASPLPDDASHLRIKYRDDARTNTTIAVIATDAKLDKAECKRLAIAAHDGFARAIWPSHTPMDGDLIFAVSTGKKRWIAKKAPCSICVRQQPPRWRERLRVAFLQQRRPRATLLRSGRSVPERIA